MPKSLPSPGYDVSFADFAEMLGEPRVARHLGPLLLDWFGYSIVGKGADAQVQSNSGAIVDRMTVHDRIQKDGEKQLVFYRLAMSYWHGG